MVSDDERAPWHLQDGESDRAYAAFRVYLQNHYNLRGVAEETGRTYSAIKSLARRHRWSERRRLWEEHLMDLWTGEREEAAVAHIGRRFLWP